MPCRYDLDDLFAYQTERMVRIRDRRLGLAKLAISLAVFAYIVVYEAIINQGYLKLESPEGIIVSSLRRGQETGAYPDYCSPRSVALDKKLPCQYLDEGIVLFPEGEELGSMFIATRMTVSDAPVQDGCYRPFYELSGGSRQLRGDVGQVCATPPTVEDADRLSKGGKSSFVGDVESFTMMWRHAVYGPVTGSLDVSTELSFADLQFKTTPKAGIAEHARGSGDGSYLEFGEDRVSQGSDIAQRLRERGFTGTNQGDILSMSVLFDTISEEGLYPEGNGRFSLDLPSVRAQNATCGVGIDFAERACPTGCHWVGPVCSDKTTAASCEEDSRCVFNASGNAQCVMRVNSPDYCTKNTYRYDGVVVLVLVEFATPYQKQSEMGYTYHTVLLPGVSYKTIERVATATGVQFTTRRGVRVLFVQTGFISKFSFVELLKTIVSGLALLSLAKILIEVLLMKILPNSEVYHNFKYLTTRDFSDVHVTDDDPNGGLKAADYIYGQTLTDTYDIKGGMGPVAAQQNETEPYDAARKEGEGDVDGNNVPQSNVV